MCTEPKKGLEGWYTCLLFDNNGWFFTRQLVNPFLSCLKGFSIISFLWGGPLELPGFPAIQKFSLPQSGPHSKDPNWSSHNKRHSATKDLGQKICNINTCHEVLVIESRVNSLWVRISYCRSWRWISLHLVPEVFAPDRLHSQKTNQFCCIFAKAACVLCVLLCDSCGGIELKLQCFSRNPSSDVVII